MPSPALTLLDGVRWHGEPVPGARTHTLLAVLAAAAPRPVSAGELVRLVWVDEVPEHPEKALQVLVSRTRARTSPQAVELSGAGYRLGLGESDVDVLELRRLVAEARAAEAASDIDLARICAEAALALTVGSSEPDDAAMSEVVAGALATQEAARMVLAGAHLSLGDHARAMELLELLATQHPHDETLLARLLRAEAGARGVPAALTRYAAYAEETRDRLGSEPGEQLQRLHVELLALDAPVREGLKYDAAPMIGRDSDIAAIRALLDHSRVVSIVGPGGLGKTRMAHLVGRLAEQPVVQLVELAGVNSPDGLLSEIASVLGVRDSMATARAGVATSDLRGRIAQHLAGVPTLLIIDNCEHLVEAVADVVAFLGVSLPVLRVLTTSRAPLGIAAEQVYQLPQLNETDATELFRRRAVAARPGVRFDVAEVAHLVARLDGLPLAIELAAAKVRVMSVAEVSRRLDDRFVLLRGGDRSAPDRHQTLEAVIDWSWQLLGDGPREALRSLAVFPDGFSLSGADAVLGRDALADITHLAEQSLVVVREDDTVRYRFLETVREYGARRLDESGDRADVERRLFAWGVRLSRALGGRLSSPDQVAAAQDARQEAGNLTGVLRQAIDSRDRATVVPVVATLTTFWTIQGDHASVFGLSETVLDLLGDYEPAPDEADDLRAVLAEMAIATAVLSGLPPTRAMAQLRQLGPGTPGTRSNAMSRVLLAMFDVEEPEQVVLEELTNDPDPAVARTALIWLVQAQENSGEVALASQTAKRALELVDDESGPWLRALAESQLAGLAIQSGASELALASAQRALPVMEALGAYEDCVQLRSVIALVQLDLGDLAAASQTIGDVMGDERALGTLAWTFGAAGAAEVELARGDVERGLALYRESVVAARSRTYPGMHIELDLTPWVLFTEAAALVAHIQHGRREQAADLAANLRVRLPQLFEQGSTRFDVPVVGGVMVALAQWLLSDDTSAAGDDAVRLLALGDRFGYYRGIPSLSWARARDLAERRAPGVLDQMQAEYVGRRTADLPEEARSVVQRALR